MAADRAREKDASKQLLECPFDVATIVYVGNNSLTNERGLTISHVSIIL